MQWQDKIFSVLDKKYPELKDYNTDANEVVKKCFLAIRELMAEQQQIKIDGFGRFIVPYTKLWKEAHRLYKKFLRFKELGKDTTRVEERLHFMVQSYNHAVNRAPKGRVRQLLFLLEFKDNLLTTQNSIPWTYSPYSKAGQVAKTLRSKMLQSSETTSASNSSSMSTRLED